jgi:hypothetical protein
VADLYIEEYSNVGSGAGSYFAGGVPPAPTVADQKIAIAGASAQSAPFNAKTRMIVITADGACHYKIGLDPTASATTNLLPANTPRPIGVPPGYKIAVMT